MAINQEITRNGNVYALNVTNLGYQEDNNLLRKGIIYPSIITEGGLEITYETNDENSVIDPLYRSSLEASLTGVYVENPTLPLVCRLYRNNVLIFKGTAYREDIIKSKDSSFVGGNIPDIYDIIFSDDFAILDNVSINNMDYLYELDPEIEDAVKQRNRYYNIEELIDRVFEEVCDIEITIEKNYYFAAAPYNSIDAIKNTRVDLRPYADENLTYTDVFADIMLSMGLTMTLKGDKVYLMHNKKTWGHDETIFIREPGSQVLSDIDILGAPDSQFLSNQIYNVETEETEIDNLLPNEDCLSNDNGVVAGWGLYSYPQHPIEGAAKIDMSEDPWELITWVLDSKEVMPNAGRYEGDFKISGSMLYQMPVGIGWDEVDVYYTLGYYDEFNNVFYKNGETNTWDNIGKWPINKNLLRMIYFDGENRENGVGDYYLHVTGTLNFDAPSNYNEDFLEVNFSADIESTALNQNGAFNTGYYFVSILTAGAKVPEGTEFSVGLSKCELTVDRGENDYTRHNVDKYKFATTDKVESTIDLSKYAYFGDSTDLAFTRGTYKLIPELESDPNQIYILSKSMEVYIEDTFYNYSGTESLNLELRTEYLSPNQKFNYYDLYFANKIKCNIENGITELTMLLCENS